MVERMQRNGLNIDLKDDALAAEAEDAANKPAAASVIGKDKPQPGQAGGASDAERAAQAAANRARMQAMQAKK